MQDVNDSRGRPDETLTRRAVTRYAVLDTPADSALDDLVGLALTLTGARAGGIGFVDRDRIWFKSRRGLSTPEVPRARFPIRWGIADPRAEREQRSASGVITLRGDFTLGGDSFSRCAGAAVVTSDGYHIGELFVLDDCSVELDQDRCSALAALARQVMVRLELRRTMLSYQAVVDGVGRVVLQLDDNHRMLSVTPTWCSLTGFGVVRSVGRPLPEFVHPDDQPQLLTHLQELREHNRASTFECRLLRLFGGDVPVEVIARPVIDESGRRRGLVGVIADISERKAREVETQHLQKLEALGRLSAGLAHEINTPIQFVGDNTRFLAASYEAMLRLITAYRQATADGSGADLPAQSREAILAAEAETDLEYLTAEVPPAIDQSLEGVDRVATLVRAMKTFSRSGHDVQAGADLNDALQAAVTVALPQFKHVAEIECDFGDLPIVMCTIGDLNQVFLNMLLNAADAIEDKGVSGTITVRTRLDGANAVIEISDTGTGMPDEIRTRIFEPFFTTKDVGRGTGQGLALARSVIQDKHAGSISIRTKVGEGSTFTLALPVAGRPLTGEPAATGVPPRVDRTGMT